MSLATVILVLGILLLVLASKPFRRVAAILATVSVVACVIIFAWWKEDDTKRKQKRELAKTYIQPSQIELVEPRVTFSGSDGRPDRIIGRLRNNSRYTLESFEIRLLFEDCLTEKTCETVGDFKNEVYLSVPPSQSRDFENYVSGPPVSAKGKIQWNYRITSVSAQPE
jgi:hypothetical protein